MTNPKPLVVLTPEQITNIEKLAAYYTVDEIAGFIGVSESTFYRIKNRDSAAMTAYKRGKAVKDEFVIDTLYDLIADKDVSSTMFYLKARCGWSTENPLNLRKYNQELATGETEERETKRIRAVADALDKFDEDNPDD